MWADTCLDRVVLAQKFGDRPCFGRRFNNDQCFFVAHLRRKCADDRLVAVTVLVAVPM